MTDTQLSPPGSQERSSSGPPSASPSPQSASASAQVVTLIISAATAGWGMRYVFLLLMADKIPSSYGVAALVAMALPVGVQVLGVRALISRYIGKAPE